ncbi:MAG: tripartite tricarboxylate transporter substrate binding protein [Proteobacteria bacterium]|nr:tripartite tricarboxylate transporter substrate binding protein [Pseudomonadota bacterium]
MAFLNKIVRTALNRAPWRTSALCACAVIALLGGASPAQAAYPDKPITLIVPFTPGGSSDIIARSLAPVLTEELKQPVVIENVAGAGGVVGTQRVVRSAPDGYTVLLGSGSEILINKIINPSISYDATKDLLPVAFVATGPMVLLASPSLPVNNVAEMLKLAASKPGGLSYGSAGNGTPMHVAGELLKIRGNVALTHVPYRGASPALVDLMGGQIDLAISTLSAANGSIKAGRAKALATTGAQVSDLAPNIPPLGKQPGLAGFDLGVWFGLFLPAKTPSDVAQKLQAAAQKALANPEVRKKFAEQGVTASGEPADSLRKFMAGEAEKYRAVVKAANIKPE